MLKAALAILVESGHLTEIEAPNKRTSPTYIVSEAVIHPSAPTVPENFAAYMDGTAQST